MPHPKERRFEKHVRDHVEGKSVLDLGCVDHSIDQRYKASWIHDMLVESASEVLGIDILENAVQELQDKGYDVQAGDAQHLQLERSFDVVFLGDLIEHLVNFEGLFESIENHLNQDGKIIIITPNCNSLFFIGHRILGYDINPEHTVWFDAHTLTELLERHGFEPTEIRYSRQTSFNLSPVDAAGYLVETLFPDSLAKGKLVIVAQRKTD